MPCNSIGPQPASIMIVGEAPGQSEEMSGIPFVGASGQELKRMLEQAGIDFKSCRVTNVFMTRPPGNKIEEFCAKKTEVGKDYPYVPFGQGKYFRSELVGPELARLADDIRATSPTLILALGNTATWALLARTAISKVRGSVFPCSLVEGVSVLPTFHPAAILRNWSDRVVCVQDFIKANRYVLEGFAPPRRELWLAPTIEEVRRFTSEFILDCSPRPDPLAFDIETLGGTITCIGFAPRTDLSITIPFFDPAEPDRNYWRSKEEELEAWRICRDVLESSIPKLGQNGLYDIQYLAKFGIRVRNYQHDTMIRHHALYPEMEKGLGFMGSIYTDEAPWKLLRARNKDNFKIDDE